MNADALAGLSAVAVGISVDSVPSKAAWADALGIEETKLLSDSWPHGAFAASLGLFREADGFSERASLLLDEEGIVRIVEVHPLGEAPEFDGIMEHLQALRDKTQDKEET